MACNTIEVRVDGALIEFSVTVNSHGWYATRENRKRDLITEGHSTREEAIDAARALLANVYPPKAVR